MAHLLRPTTSILKTLSNSSELSQLNVIRKVSQAKAATYKQTLLNLPPTRVTVLDNGFRVATEDTSSSAASVGLWINSGSRYENESTIGVANFFERLALKGTKKRSRTDLEVEIENLGAKLNSFTSREQSAFYATCLPQDVPKIVEILSDIIQNSKFEEAEVEKERKLILDEMDDLEYNDLRTVVMDYLHATAFQGTALAHSVYGNTESVKSITRQNIVDYANIHLKAPRIVLAAAGGIEHESLVQLAENHFKDMAGSYLGEAPVVDPCRYTGSDLTFRHDGLPYAHVALAVQGVTRNNPDWVALEIAKTLIGSWDPTYGGGANNASIMAQAGAVLHCSQGFESFNINYKDTGLWGMHFVCDCMTLEEFVGRLQEEWRRICMQLTDFEVERAKNTLRAKVLLQTQTSEGACQEIGTQILSLGRRQPFHELDAMIEAETAKSVQDTCNRYIYDTCPVIGAYGPIEQLRDYNWFRSGTFSLIA